MPKAQKTKTTLEKEGLQLALQIQEWFEYTKTQPIKMKQTTVAGKLIQQFLDKNAKLAKHNTLKGIIAIKDTFKNATGARVHLIPLVSGPIADAFSERSLPKPIDYELKSKLFTIALNSAAGKKMIDAGNIHVHVLNCFGKIYTPKDLIDFLKEEHGYQNEVLQLAGFQIFYLDTTNAPSWQLVTSGTLRKMLA